MLTKKLKENRKFDFILEYVINDACKGNWLEKLQQRGRPYI